MTGGVFAVVGNFEDVLLVDKFVVGKSEAGEAVARFAFERVIKVDPFVVRESGIERDSEESAFAGVLFISNFDFECGDGFDLPVFGFDQFYGAGSFDDENVAVGGNRDLHGIDESLGNIMDSKMLIGREGSLGKKQGRDGEESEEHSNHGERMLGGPGGGKFQAWGFKEGSPEAGIPCIFR